MMTMTSTLMKKYTTKTHIPYVDVGNLGNEIIEQSKNENDGFKKEYAVCRKTKLKT